MKSTIISTRFNWIADSTQPSFFDDPLLDIERTTMPMPRKIGDASFISVALPMNMVVRRGYHHFRPEAAGKLQPMFHCVEEFVEPALCVQSPKKGRVILEERRVGQVFEFGPSGCLFQHIDAFDNLPTVDTSEDFEVTVLIAGKSILDTLLGEEECGMLLKNMNIASVPSASVRKIPYPLRNILYSSIPDHLTGTIRKLFMQSKVLEYLCGLAEHFACTVVPERQEQNRIEVALKEIHEELLLLEGKLPMLNELAMKYNMTAQKLGLEFKKRYGQSIYLYINELRLNEARGAILRTDIPLKAIATKLGYSHVNHFSRAFSKLFDCSPGSLRCVVDPDFQTVD